MSSEKAPEPAPGDGLRSLKSTALFRAVNYELYVKPNKGIMIFGLIAILGCSGYIFYMRQKYEKASYYPVVAEDGTFTYKKKQSKWDD